MSLRRLGKMMMKRMAQGVRISFTSLLMITENIDIENIDIDQLSEYRSKKA